MMMMGFTKEPKLSVLYPGEDIYLARNMTMASFTSSEGWKVEGHSLIHLLAPPAVTPITGINTRTSKTNEKTNSGNEIFLINEGLNIYAAAMKTIPMTMVNICLLK